MFARLLTLRDRHSWLRSCGRMQFINKFSIDCYVMRKIQLHLPRKSLIVYKYKYCFKLQLGSEEITFAQSDEY